MTHGLLHGIITNGLLKSIGLAGMLLLLMASCTTQRRLTRLDQEVAGLLDQAQQIQFGEEIEPERLDIDGYTPFVPGEDGDALSLDLRKALELAARHSREYQTAKETLYLSALSLRSAQHSWEWNPTNNLSALLGIKQNPSETTFSTDSSLGFSKRLLSGGRIAGSLALSTLRYFSGDHSVSMQTIANLTVNQPLLRGSGALVAREPLTQAERNLIYALRHYVRTREALLITIADLYYDVLNAGADLRVAEQSLASFQYSAQRSEAMGEFGGKVTQIDIGQARQRVLTAESNLVTCQANLRSAKDRLKIALAIPLDLEITVDAADMQDLLTKPLPSPQFTLDEAIALALSQRLDLATQQDQLADAERAIRIAEDDMRAEVNLTGSATARSARRNRLSTPRLGDAEYSVGLDIDLPLDRTEETIALRRAQIARQRQQRAVSATQDEIVQALRGTWVDLEAYARRVEIQKLSVQLAEQRVENSRMLFEDGRIAIRDYLDAQDDLSDARNSLTRQLVAHRMSWLRLLYQLDELNVDAQTLWTERLEMN
ncbi:MAG: TolC family protein [Victivallales bacterium]|nr:TolC family protein [Victivallales bacterium]